jgi:vacuolar-type H+-ATPase subunit E/Vma4
VASIDEIVSQLQSATDQVNESIQSLSGAESDTGELQSQMSAAGMQDKVEILGAVKDAIENVRNHLATGVDLIEESMNQAKSAGG